MNSSPSDKNDSSRARIISRRKFLGGAFALALAGGVSGKAVFHDTHQIEVSRHTVPVIGLKDSLFGLKIVQISDLHRGVLVGQPLLEQTVSMVQELEPDLVVITGDFVTRDYEYIHSCASVLGSLKPSLGVYGILGNHDHRASAPVIVRRLKASSVRILINNNVQIESGLWLAGVDDLWRGRPNLNLTFNNVPRNDARILMSHNPEIIDLLPPDIFALAGHTHGGQINIGYLTNILTSQITDHGRFTSGWYQNGTTKMYVNRGIGVVGIPARFRCPPEITLFELKSA